jgi:hypothetical protein
MADTEYPRQASGGFLGLRRSKSRFSRIKLCLMVISLTLTGLLGLESYRVVLGRNIHTVISGKVYRCAQPSEAALAELVGTHHIRTVVNLRGTSPMEDWYRHEARATSSLELSQFDICMSAYRLPSASEWKQLIDVLDHAEYPILLHCRRGSDRTGLVAAAIVLLSEGSTMAEAQRQLNWRFGHIALGRTANLSLFLQYYSDWLEQRQQDHTPALFRQWVLSEYRGGPCGCTFESCSLPAEPVHAGQAFTVTVRVRNTGCQAWQFSPMPLAGTHLTYNVQTMSGGPVANGKAGYMDARVEPGAFLELRVPLAGIAQPGEYRLILELQNEQLGSFYQMGSDPLEMRLKVRE